MRRKREARDTDGRRTPERWNRGMLFFFGPPQLGRGGEAPPVVERDPLCPFCGFRESQHTIFRDEKASRAACPTPAR
jgi:hypothetical protein